MKIALVSTGGTIAMAQESGQEISALAFDASYFAKELRLSEDDELKIIDYSKLPSSNFDASYARKLADKLTEVLDDVEGIIVTHGTDTMEETSFYLDMVIDNVKPIALTGAMMTGTQPGYDGVSNLRNATKVIKSPHSFDKGVLVVFNKDIICAVHGAKVESERPNAFGSIQTGKIGSVNGNNVLYYYNVNKHIKLRNKLGGKVCLLKLHYDIEPELVRYCCKKSDAVVFECYGSGRVPPKLLQIIDDLDDKIVILTTRVFNGHLYDEYSYDGSYQYFLDRKVVFSPLNSLKSCILVKLCMGNQKSYNESKDIFESFFG